MDKRKKRKIKATDLYRFKLIQGLALSPDGKNVVYSVQRVDRKKQKPYVNLWAQSTQGGKPRRFTVGEHVDRQPEWSPDGRALAFISNRQDAEQPQLYIIPFDGGEAQPLTALKGTFGNFTWSPDGKKIAFRFRKKDEKALVRMADPAKKELGIVYRHIDRLFYRLDGEGYFPKERWHIWVVNVKNGKLRQLTDGPLYEEGDPVWSPDGKLLAFMSNRAENPELSPDAVDVYIMPAKGGALRALHTPPGQKRLPSFSPDGRWIAYIGKARPGDWWQNDNLWIVPVDEGGEVRNLTAAHDLTVSAFTLNDMGAAALMPPTWALDGGALYIQVSQHGKTMLQRVAMATGAVEDVLAPQGVMSYYAFDAAQEKAVYLLGQTKDPGQIWIRDMQEAVSKPLTSLNRPLLRKLDLGDVEEVWFTGPDDNDLQGWILKPPGFDPQQSYPSILEIHGGPLAQYGYAFMHEFYYLAAQGYVVYFCNPRGGLGYGEAHASAIWGQWGTVDYADLMAWVDYVAALPYIDSDRLCVTGGSYGGYMTAWMLGHTTRFCAAVAQRSVTNLISMWGSSDNNWLFQQPFGDRPPYTSIEQLWECSPLKHIGGATTPTLILHSEKDMRCPLEQSQQLFVALKTLGIDTELVLFPDESHGLSRIGRTDRRIARLKHMRRWFRLYTQ